MAKSHKISIVMFPPSQRGLEVKTPFAKADLYTLEGESVHDRVGRLQAETENVMFQITSVSVVGEPVLDGTGVSQMLPIMPHEAQATAA